MKALTIHPVWAWAIVAGHKRVENRTWRTSHRGPLLIHASADSPAARRSDAEARRVLAALGVDVPADVPRGAVIGLVDLAECLPGPIDGDPLAAGPICWMLRWPRRLPRPIPARGRLSIWDCDISREMEPPAKATGPRKSKKVSSTEALASLGHRAKDPLIRGNDIAPVRMV